MSLDLSSLFLYFKVGMVKPCKNGGYAFGDFRLDRDKRMLYRDEQEVLLPPKVVETLIVLVENQGEIVSKADLMEKVWADSVVEESNLSQHLYILRRTLGDAGNGRPVIETLRRRGYRFNAPTTVIDTAPASSAAAPATEPAPRPTSSNLSVRRQGNVLTVTDWEPAPAAADDTPNPAQPKPLSRSRMLIVLAIAAVVIVAAFGAYQLATRTGSDDARAASGPLGQISITRLTTSGRTKRSAISPDGNHVAHVTDDSGGQSLWVRHIAAPTDVRIAGPAATEYVSVTFSPDGGFVYYVGLDRDKGDSTLYRVPVLGGPSLAVASDIGPFGFSPDGSQIAFLRFFDSEVSGLIQANADGSNQQTLATRRFPNYFLTIWNAPAWSLDGRTIFAPVRENDERGPYETVIGFGLNDRAEHRPVTSRWQYVGQPRSVPDGLLVTASETATDPMQVWHVSALDGNARRVTNDLNNYHDLSVTADGGRIALVQVQVLSSLWVASNADKAQAKQIGSEVGWIDEMAWGSDGRIFYRPSGSAEIWTSDAEGQGTKQLTAGAAAGRGFDVTPDGRHLVFSSTRSGRFHIWRMNIDGSGLSQLSFGDGEFYPECSPDGQWIVYQSADEMAPTIWKISIDGGEAVRLTDTKALRPAISPDGKLVAFHYLDPEPEGSKWRIGIVSMDGSLPMRRFDLPSTVTKRIVRWSPDGKAVVYPNDEGGLSDLWMQPLEGGPPRKITNFKADQIMTFDWSIDNRWLAYVRSVETSNVVLIGSLGQDASK